MMSGSFHALVRIDAGSGLVLLPGAHPWTPSWPASRLGAATRFVRGATLRQLDKAWAQLDRELPDHAQALAGLAPDPFRQALDLTVQARLRGDLDLRAANSFAAAAAGQLRRALAEAANELARRERQAVAAVAVQAARNLGYRVQWGEGKRTTAVEARRDADLVLLGIADGGDVETDHAGTTASPATLIAEMARLGVVLRGARAHGARRDGLLGLARRHDDDALTRGVIRARERRRAPQRPRTLFRRDWRVV
jgi:hypothetical protein